MTEQKFKKGQRVRFIKHDDGRLEEERGLQIGEIYKIDDVWEPHYCIRISGHSIYLDEWQLESIEPAEPRRYTGELKEGMRVMNEMTKSAMIVGSKGNGLTVKYIPDGVTNFDIRKTKDGWVLNGFNDYISHVISEPEEKKPAETTSFADGFRQFEEWRKCGMPNFCLGNEEDASPYLMHMGADGFAVPVPIMAHPNCKISFKNSPHKGGIQTFMDTLRSIPAKIKRILNPNYKAFYQLEWVDEELDLTAQGRIELLDMLLDKHEAELGELAKKEVARRKKHSVQDEE